MKAPVVMIDGEEVLLDADGDWRKSFFVSPTAHAISVSFPRDAQVFKRLDADLPDVPPVELSSDDFGRLGPGYGNYVPRGLLGELEPYWITCVIQDNDGSTAVYEIGAVEKLRLDIARRTTSVMMPAEVPEVQEVAEKPLGLPGIPKLSSIPTLPSLPRLGSQEVFA